MTAPDAAPADWQVRTAQDHDHDRWRELYEGYGDFYGERQPDASTELVWSWILDPDHEVDCLLVEDPQGQVAGLAHYRPFARPLAADVGCFLDDLFVDPAYRGTGAVDALLVELRRMALDRGWSVVRWITAEDNHRARAKYDQHATRASWITYDMTPG